MSIKYTQPRTIPTTPKLITRPGKRQKSMCSDEDDSDVAPRKQHRRVSKACERCRLKKTKCDGEMPCQRCTDDMVTCCEGARKKGGSKTVAESCVELLEYQQTKFIAGHLKMYKLMVDAGIWTFGEVRKNSRGIPVVHDILEKLGVMRSGTELPNGFPESPEENRAVRAHLEASKDQKSLDNYNDEFKLPATAESSMPSLVHTDRESSIDTCSSEAKSNSQTESNSMIMMMSSGQNLNHLVSGFQPQDLDTCASWNFNPHNNEESLVSSSLQPGSVVASSTNNSFEDHVPLESQKISSWYFNQWNGFKVDNPIIMSNLMHSLPQDPIPSQDLPGFLINPSATFNSISNIGDTEFLRQKNMDLEMTPTVMKYAYDPYMG